MTEEQYCCQMLAELRKSYELDAKPYLDRLARIKGMSPAPAIVLTTDQAREFIELTMGTKSTS